MSNEFRAHQRNARASRAMLYQFFGKSGDAAKVLDVGQIARTAHQRGRVGKSRTSVG